MADAVVHTRDEIRDLPAKEIVGGGALLLIPGLDDRHAVHRRPSGDQGNAEGHALRSIVLVLEHVEDDMRYERTACQVRKRPAAEENTLLSCTRVPGV